MVSSFLDPPGSRSGAGSAAQQQPRWPTKTPLPAGRSWRPCRGTSSFVMQFFRASTSSQNGIRSPAMNGARNADSNRICVAATTDSTFSNATTASTMRHQSSRSDQHRSMPAAVQRSPKPASGAPPTPTQQVHRLARFLITS